MSFYSVSKFCILSPLNILNRFTLAQRRGLLEIYYQNIENLSEITNICGTNLNGEKDLQCPLYAKLLLRFVVGAPKRERSYLFRMKHIFILVIMFISKNVAFRAQKKVSWSTCEAEASLALIL